MDIRFVHTADWQLGFTREFLAGEAQHRFAEARVDAVRAVGRLAASAGARFVVCAGDVFEHNQVEARTVLRAMDALRECPVPVYLLPGNHDPLDAASVFRSRTFAEARPEHVHVLTSSDPVALAAGVELVGVPWRSRQVAGDPVARLVERLEPTAGIRILVAHGSLEGVVYAGSAGAQIARGPVEAALADGRLHYVALGDRHSVADVGGGGRIWYAGTPEVTRFREQRPGHALVVEVGRERCSVAPHRVGRWTFLHERRTVSGIADVELLAAWLGDRRDQGCTVVRLTLDGRLSLEAAVRLDAVLADARASFAAVDVDPAAAPVVLPDAADRDALGLSGYAARTLDLLLDDAPHDPVARDAVALLHQLASGRPVSGRLVSGRLVSGR